MAARENERCVRGGECHEIDSTQISDPFGGSFANMCPIPCLQHKNVVVRFAVRTRSQTSSDASSAEWSSRSFSPTLL